MCFRSLSGILSEHAVWSKGIKNNKMLEKTRHKERGENVIFLAIGGQFGSDGYDVVDYQKR